MPPKRKRADAESEAPASGSHGGGASEVTSTTKAKTSTTSGRKKAVEKTSKTKLKAEEVHQQTVDLEESYEPPFKKGSSQRRRREATVETKSLPYTNERMQKLFAMYADEDNPSIIGAEGLEKLCMDADISMEGAQPLVLAWLLGASELGKLTMEEWVNGFHVLQIDTLPKLKIALTEFEALLIFNTIVAKPPSSSNKSAGEPYNRNATYWPYAVDASGVFLKFYRFVFSLAKAPQERNIDVEVAKVFWSTLLGHKYPMVNELIEYIDDKTSLKGVNKDLWAMTLDFFRCVGPSLEGYDTEGAWPAILDEFAAWKKANTTNVTPPLALNY